MCDLFQTVEFLSGTFDDRYVVSQPLFQLFDDFENIQHLSMIQHYSN